MLTSAALKHLLGGILWRRVLMSRRTGHEHSGETHLGRNKRQFEQQNALQVLSCDASSGALALVAVSPRLRRWTLAVALLPLPAPRAAAGGALMRRGRPAAAAAGAQQPAAALAVGSADNSVLLYALAFGAAEQQVPAVLAAAHWLATNTRAHRRSSTA